MKRNHDLVLIEKEPFSRLKELCKLGGYRYSIFWDSFNNGRLTSCELFQMKNGYKKILHRETQFIKDNFHDNVYVRNVISQSLLHNIGFGDVEEYRSETPVEDELGNLNTQMMSTLTRVIERTLLRTADDE